MRRTMITALAQGATLGFTLAGNAVLANNFSIDVSNDDIAVEATNASLKELLQELEKLTGIPVKFVAETDERVTLNVGMTNIENAIGKITPNHMIVHGTKDGTEVIKELIIIPAESDLSSGTSGSAFLPSGDPAPAIAQPQAIQNGQAVQNGTAVQNDESTMQSPISTAESDPNQSPTPDGQVN